MPRYHIFLIVNSTVLPLTYSFIIMRTCIFFFLWFIKLVLFWMQKNAILKYTVPLPSLVCVRKVVLHWFMAKMSAPLFVHHEDFLFVPSPNSRTFWNQSWIVKGGDAFLCVGSSEGVRVEIKIRKRLNHLQVNVCRQIALVPTNPGSATYNVCDLGSEAWNLWMPIFSFTKWDERHHPFWAMVGINERMCVKDMAQGLLYTCSVIGAVFRTSAQLSVGWHREEGDCCEMVRPTASGFIRPQILLHLKVVLKCVRWCMIPVSLSRNGDREMVVLQPLPRHCNGITFLAMHCPQMAASCIWKAL